MQIGDGAGTHFHKIDVFRLKPLPVQHRKRSKGREVVSYIVGSKRVSPLRKEEPT
jgi:hypothetical protein